MAHVELSVTEDAGRLPPEGLVPAPASKPAGARVRRIVTPFEPGESGVRRWSSVVAEAVEPCLAIDADRVIVAASPRCCQLLGLDPGTAHGRTLRDAISLLDFTAEARPLDDGEADKIPPLLAISSRRLARGLMRVAGPGPGTPHPTMDAIATPLLEGAAVVGSLTFFAEV